MKSNNPFINTRIEFHILQSFPVSCLNRDDVGSPKTATIGGTTRARVSSQCWKRQVRMEMKKLGITCGDRTRLVDELIKSACLEKGANEDQAKACGRKFAQMFIKEKNKQKGKKESIIEDNNSVEDKDNDTLIFLSPSEVEDLAEKFEKVNFDASKVGLDAKKFKMDAVINAVDVALFGRMVAKIATMNVEAAACFSHSISTHAVSNEIDFFTALDDLKADPGAGHIGSLEFNSATYYRYVSLDLGQLWQTLRGQNFSNAVIAFIKALFIAVPNARQTTMSGASFWDFAKIFIRKGQRLQVPFETAIKAEKGGFLQPSINALKSYLTQKERMAGSLFQKQTEYTLGENENFNIDELIISIESYISGVQHE